MIFHSLSTIQICLGMRKGDEIVMINSFIVQDLDLNTFDGCLEQIPIVVTLRSSRLDKRNQQTERKRKLLISFVFIDALLSLQRH